MNYELERLSEIVSAFEKLSLESQQRVIEYLASLYKSNLIKSAKI